MYQRVLKVPTSPPPPLNTWLVVFLITSLVLISVGKESSFATRNMVSKSKNNQDKA